MNPPLTNPSDVPHYQNATYEDGDFEMDTMSVSSIDNDSTYRYSPKGETPSASDSYETGSALREVELEVGPFDNDGKEKEGDVESITDEASKEGKPDVKPLGIIGLVSMVYFLVAGGAYGTEDLAGSIPGLYALIGK